MWVKLQGLWQTNKINQSNLKIKNKWTWEFRNVLMFLGFGFCNNALLLIVWYFLQVGPPLTWAKQWLKIALMLAADEVPVKPSVTEKYTQLLIDGKFVDAASGNVDEFGLKLANSKNKIK